MSGVIESLNVSVAAGVMLYEAVRQRGWQTATLLDRLRLRDSTITQWTKWTVLTMKRSNINKYAQL
jgi:hypothetical protein